jgi:beta-lactamase class A
LSESIAEKQQEGAITEASVYFRDLEAGPTLGIRENEDFSPASLLKLPFVLAYFRYEEERGGFVNQSLVYQGEAQVAADTIYSQIEKPPSLELGKNYSVEELMQRAITFSDNQSHFLLGEKFTATVPDGVTEILRTFQDLGIIDPRSPTEEVVSVRNYALLFRALYFVSYLNPAHSEQVLSWMAASTYNKGLEAGVPAGVKIAHKFGERELEGGLKQLHDCGIVYYPDNPYVLCIMTKGTDWDEMAAVIGEISRRVYEEVDSRRL